MRFTARLGGSELIKKNFARNFKQDRKMEKGNTLYIESKTFDKTNFTVVALPKGEYDNCTFTDCEFYTSDLTGINFTECSFNGCNLSLAKISQAAFKEVTFRECKLLGLHFENCNPFLFAIDFDRSTLNLSSFYQLNLKRCKFKKCSLQEVDFTEADLSALVLDHCDLAGAIFENSMLEKTDFRSTFNYTIDPEKNRMKKARFSLSGVSGLLNKYGILLE